MSTTGRDAVTRRFVQVGDRRLGRSIPYRQVFGPDVDDGIPFSESAAWIRQFVTAAVPEAGYFLLVGDETYPEQIWHGYTSNVNRFFRCIYVRPRNEEES